MKRRKILLVCICIITVLSCSFIIYSKNKNNVKSISNFSNKIEKSDKPKNNKSAGNDKKEDIVEEKNKSTEEKKEKKDSQNRINDVSKKSSNTTTNNTNEKKDNSNNSTSNNSSNKSNNTTQSSSTSSVKVEKTMTAWEKLGISEYEYYNSPGPNEGEIAFNKPESACESAANTITKMYAFVTHFGDVKSYSDRYIGCWITIHLPNGEWMFYGKFKEREKRGDFKDALIKD